MLSDNAKRSIRTVLQTLGAVAVVVPAAVHASGIRETLPWVAGGLALAGGLARVMALPSVQALLDRVGLGTADPK
jgi:hypothetical protein